MDDSATPLPPNSHCAHCGTSFRCGRDDPAPCWCARDFPAVMPLPAPEATAGCLCPACLRAAVARQPQSPAD
ncbi:MAG: hypothetical protein DRR03_09480 [Gammaproteobacteria bacterium]|nr:MAG: hypothetical protein DRR03_09480 [Gammaproteobacteria bacterium]